MLIKWVSARDLLGPDWNITQLQLFKFIDEGLQPYDKEDKDKPLISPLILVSTLQEIAEREPRSYWKVTAEIAQDFIAEIPKLVQDKDYEQARQCQNLITVLNSASGLPYNFEARQVQQFLDEACFKISDVEWHIKNKKLFALDEQSASNSQEFAEGFHKEDILRIKELRKDKLELGETKAKTPEGWAEKKNRLAGINEELDSLEEMALAGC
jgi:hypothetical protein